MQCAQAQMIVDQLLDAADTRIELARQSNSAADMRAAVDALQATMRDVRAQLAPCANVQPPPDPHLGHISTPASPPPSAPVAPPPASPKPPGTADPHAGHTMAPAKPAPAPAKPPAPRTPAAAPAKPAPADPHAGHAAAPAKPSPAPAKSAPAKPSTPAAGTTKPKAQPQSPAQAVDPVCGLKVDPEAAPSATHNGRTYHFCSEQHRELFQKNPVKYAPKQE
jgi:YHS domain-containing protein